MVLCLPLSALMREIEKCKEVDRIEMSFTQGCSEDYRTVKDLLVGGGQLAGGG